MSSKHSTRAVEPFAFYEGLGRPFLMRTRTAVSWSDGTLFRYPEFNKAVNTDALYQDLTALWEIWRPRLTRKSELGWGGVVGALTSVPPAMAEQGFEIVKQYFAAVFESHGHLKSIRERRKPSPPAGTV